MSPSAPSVLAGQSMMLVYAEVWAEVTSPSAGTVVMKVVREARVREGVVGHGREVGSSDNDVVLSGAEMPSRPCCPESSVG